jgi:hypothetical protein
VAYWIHNGKLWYGDNNFVRLRDIDAVSAPKMPFNHEASRGWRVFGLLSFIVALVVVAIISVKDHNYESFNTSRSGLALWVVAATALLVTLSTMAIAYIIAFLNTPFGLVVEAVGKERVIDTSLNSQVIREGAKYIRGVIAEMPEESQATYVGINIRDNHGTVNNGPGGHNFNFPGAVIRSAKAKDADSVTKRNTARTICAAIVGLATIVGAIAGVLALHL